MISKTNVKQFFKNSFDFPSNSQQIKYLTIENYFISPSIKTNHLYLALNSRISRLPHSRYRFSSLLKPLIKSSGF